MQFIGQPQPLPDDPVLKLLLSAGMVSGAAAATAGCDEDGRCGEVLHGVALLVSDLYGSATIVRRLCSESAMLLVRGLRDGVRAGEVRFFRHEGAWAFELTEATGLSIVSDPYRSLASTAARLIVVYANVLVGVWEDLGKADSFFEPSSGTLSDTDFWNSLMGTIPDGDRMTVLEILLVLGGILRANQDACSPASRKGR